MIHVFKAILLLLCTLTVYRLGEGLNDLSSIRARDLPLSGIQRPYVDIATLGYSDAWDRVISIWTLQQSESSPATSPEEIYRIYMNAVRLRPKSANLYIMGSAALTINRKRYDLSLDILRAGVEVFPQNWTLHSFLALNYFLLHNDMMALKYFESASNLPGAPNYLKGIIEKFYAQGNFDSEEILGSVDKTLASGSLKRLRDRLILENSQHLKDSQNEVQSIHE